MKNCSSALNHQCRPDCGACCITPSISSPIPGMPHGKPANTKCVQLSDDLLCNLFNQSKRPDVCKNFTFDPLICGKNKDEAMKIMSSLE
jgi:Fe-S-cluster containining protein